MSLSACQLTTTPNEPIATLVIDNKPNPPHLLGMVIDYPNKTLPHKADITINGTPAHDLRFIHAVSDFGKPVSNQGNLLAIHTGHLPMNDTTPSHYTLIQTITDPTSQAITSVVISANDVYITP